ncbi:MAG: sugar phosphate isomerase/epimerase family protein [Streptosporangiales bacterium]
MNTLGLHGMVWVGGWSEREAREAIARTAEAGFDLIELPALDPASFDVDLTARLLEEHGLRAVASLGLTDDTDVSSTDPDAVARGRAVLGDALALVRDLGGDYLGGVVYSKLGRYTEPASPQAVENSRASVAWLAEQARRSGITIGLEVVNRYESNVLNTHDDALAFITDTGADNVVVHLDTYHMNIEEPDFHSPLRGCGSKLGYLHVGESHRGALGTGTIDWDELFTAVHDVGYDGTITFESFSSAVVHPSLSSTLAIWRNTWTDGAALARNAHDFLMKGLGDSRQPGH